jgi:hypothetical protein
MTEQDLHRRVRVLETLVQLLIEAIPRGPRAGVLAKAQALHMATGMLDYLGGKDQGPDRVPGFRPDTPLDLKRGSERVARAQGPSSMARQKQEQDRR